MSKWDKYKVYEQPSASRWDKYKVNKLPESKSQIDSLSQVEDYLPGVVGKSFNRGFASLADLPQTALSLTESALNLPAKAVSYISGKPEPYNLNYWSNTKPISESIKEFANERGLDWLDKPKINKNSLGKKLLSNSAETAGSFIAGGAAGKALQGAGALRAAKFFGSPNSGKELANLAKSGAVLGATSGSLEAMGVDPLIAEVVAAPALTAGSSSLLSKFGKKHRTMLAKKKVADTFASQMGGKEAVNDALEKIESYKSNPNTLINPTTPEIIDNVGLSRIYQTKGLNSTPIAQRALDNNKSLTETISNLGKTGLEESILGASLREPIFKRFERKKALRSKVTAPLYEKLRLSPEGIIPQKSLDVLSQEIKEAGPAYKKSLEKYYKALEETNLSKQENSRYKALENEIAALEQQYQGLSPEALSQIKSPLNEEITALNKKSQLRPIQLENTIQELGDKVNSARIQGKNDEALKYGRIKQAALEDLSKNKEGLAHREMYKRASKGINEIEKTPLLNNFVKENKDFRKLDGFVLGDEKIPSEILKADLTNTKKLVDQVKHNKDQLALVKGVYVDELLRKAKTANSDLSFDKVKKFVYDKKNNEKIKAVFSESEVKKLESVVDALERRQKVLGAGKMGGSHTAQLLKIENELNDSLSSLKSWAVGLTAKATGTNKFGKEALNYGIDKFNKIRNGKRERLIEEALLSPEKFKDLFNAKPKTLLEAFKPQFKENIKKSVIPAINNPSKNE